MPQKRVDPSGFLWFPGEGRRLRISHLDVSDFQLHPLKEPTLGSKVISSRTSLAGAWKPYISSSRLVVLR